MALGKTVTYTPFQETSFGYGSAEIATAHSTDFPNSDDIVKVTIQWISGNWDQTGHLSTPAVGTAVAVYHESKQLLVIKGERDDVDAVLDELSFFPADHPESRPYDETSNTDGFAITAWKENQTTGIYAGEEPPSIGDTTFTLRVYDGATSVGSYNVIFDPTEPSYGNQRPYWSTIPAGEDLNSTEHDTVAGGLVDLGTVSHGTDTENVRVKCEFRTYGDTNQLTGSSYGYFTGDDSLYIGDKKPATRNTSDARFDFTGSVAEAQAFLDNIRYYNNGNERTFDMYLTVTDGVVGSYVTKTVYFSDATIGVSTIPDNNYVEDANPAYWDFGDLVFTNVQPDANTFTCTITLDSTGRGGCSSFGTSTTVDTDSYNSGTGVLTITDNSFSTFKTALRNLEFTPVADFNDGFTFTVDFTFSNATVGSSYTATQQTITVVATEKKEVTNLSTSHTYTEDQKYDFENGVYPQIIHGYNHNFDVIFTLSDSDAGVLWRKGNVGFYRSFGTGIYKLSGTRDEVNTALKNLYFSPSIDYAENFTISFTVDRTSGDLTFEEQSTGSFTMTAVEVSEFQFIDTTINWENNVSSEFQSGLLINDASSENVQQPAYESTYTVEMRLRKGTNPFTDGVITSTRQSLLESHTGSGTNTYTITGSRQAININLNNMKFIPDAFYDSTVDFYIDYKVTRNYDSVVFTEFSESYRTLFSNPTITAPYTDPFTAQLFDWEEDVALLFDTGLEITEKVTNNPDYTTYYNTDYQITLKAKYWDGSASQDFTSMDWSSSNFGDAIISGKGTNSDPLIITGKREELNIALANMSMTPNTADFTHSPATNGSFWIDASIKRVQDSQFIMNFTPQISIFNAGTDVAEYNWDSSIPLTYTEDVQNQRIFSAFKPVNDGAGDFFDAIYTVRIGLANTTTGEFGDYVEDGYVADDYVDPYEVSFTGTKDFVNNAIKNVKFTPYVDVNTNVDLIYSQERRIGTSSVTHADEVTVRTIVGIDAPEFVYGTSQNNYQRFVPDAFINGLDLAKYLPEEGVVSETSPYFDSDITTDIKNGTTVKLTPKQITENLGFEYDRPITITDTAESGGGPSQYRIQFSGGSLFNIGATLEWLDSGWMSKDDLHELLDNGITASGIGDSGNDYDNPSASIPEVTYQLDNAPEPLSENDIIYPTYIVNFTVSRRTYDGTVTQIGQGSLTYEFRTGLTLWYGLNLFPGGTYNNTSLNGDRTPYFKQRIDNITDDYIAEMQDGVNIQGNIRKRWYFTPTNASDLDGIFHIRDSKHDLSNTGRRPIVAYLYEPEQNKFSKLTGQERRGYLSSRTVGDVVLYQNRVLGPIEFTDQYGYPIWDNVVGADGFSGTEIYMDITSDQDQYLHTIEIAIAVYTKEGVLLKVGAPLTGDDSPTLSLNWTV